jgi:hypothetical protein
VCPLGTTENFCATSISLRPVADENGYRRASPRSAALFANRLAKTFRPSKSARASHSAA